MPAYIWLVAITVRQIEHSATVVLEKIPDGSVNLIFNQTRIALVLMVQNSAAEQSQFRYKSSVPEAVGDIAIERYTGYERSVPVLVGCGSVG